MREREVFFRNACHQKDREYQALMDEQLNGFDKLEKLKTELNQTRNEVKARDRYLDNLQKQLEEKEQAMPTGGGYAIATLQTQLDELNSEWLKLKNDKWLLEISVKNKDKELEEKELAIATLQAQSQQQLQLTLPLVTDSLDPAVEQLQSEKPEILEEQTPAGKVEPETDANQAAPINPEPETVTSQESPVISQQSSAVSNQESANGDWVEVGRGELMDYIYKRFPGAEVEIKPQNITDAINGKSKRMPEFEEKYRFKHIGKRAGQHRFKIPNNY